MYPLLISFSNHRPCSVATLAQWIWMLLIIWQSRSCYIQRNILLGWLRVAKLVILPEYSFSLSCCSQLSCKKTVGSHSLFFSLHTKFPFLSLSTAAGFTDMCLSSVLLSFLWFELYMIFDHYDVFFILIVILIFYFSHCR